MNRVRQSREGNRNDTVLITSISLVLLFMVSSIALAETYYVDYQGGDDSNDGVSPFSPLKHCPGDPRATGNAKITLSAGDIIVFKGGVTYEFSPFQKDHISAGSSGLFENKIIYRSGHLHDLPWPDSSERAVINGSNADVSFNEGVINLKNYNHIRIEGLAIQNSPWNPYSGCISSHLATEGDIYIHNVELTGCSNGIYIRGDWFDDDSMPTGYTVSDSTIYSNIGHGILVRAGVEDVQIIRNLIYHNGYEGGKRVGDGIFFDDGGDIRPSDVRVSENVFYDGVYKGHIVLQGADNVVIEKNYFWENEDHVRFGIAMTKGNNVTIRDNLIVDTNETSELEGLIRIWADKSVPSQNIDNVNIINNTLIGESAGYSIYIRCRSGYHISNIVIRNNIINAGGANYICLDCGMITNFRSDYNLFLNGDSSPFCWNSRKTTFREWQTKIGEDLNSIQKDLSFDEAHKPASSDSPSKEAGNNLSEKYIH